MTRAEGVRKRKQALLDKLGSEAAVSEYYRELQKKSRQTYKGTGGFHYLKKHNPERLKQIQKNRGGNGKPKSE